MEKPQLEKFINDVEKLVASMADNFFKDEEQFKKAQKEFLDLLKKKKINSLTLDVLRAFQAGLEISKSASPSNFTTCFLLIVKMIKDKEQEPINKIIEKSMKNPQVI